MDFLNILNISAPTGVWASIINAFESGVGSYLLAIVLITLIIKILLSPFDFFNKRISKKQAQTQAKLKPQIDDLQKKYGHDKNLLNQKTQALYKKSGMSMGGSCLFMIAFMAINMTIFFTLFGSLNTFADYKINQQYLTIKEGYSNVLNLTNDYLKTNTINSDLLKNFEENTFEIFKKGEEEWIKAVDKDGNLIHEVKVVEDYSSYEKTTEKLDAGKDITNNIIDFNDKKTYTQVRIEVVEGGETVHKNYFILTEEIKKEVIEEKDKFTIKNQTDLYKFISSDENIKNLINIYTVINEDNAGVYEGDEIVEGEVTVQTAVQTLAMKEVIKSYEFTQKENSFLWIGSIWVADSPFKNSIFTFDQYKAEIGVSNVSSQEEVIYNAFMKDLRDQKGRVNGYFILAVLSVGISFLSMWLSQKHTNKKSEQPQKTNKIMMIVMPLITGIFAILYNSVFAIYLLVSQAIGAALAPINNIVIEKIDNVLEKKKKEKNKSVIDYRRDK